MTYTLDHGNIARDGSPLLTLVRARWGDDAPPAADLDALSQRIVALLNADQPQVYVFLDSGGILDYEVTRGDVDVVAVDWDENAERDESDWTDIIETLERLAPGELRESELTSARAELQQLIDYREAVDGLIEQARAKAIADAEALLRDAGRL